MVAMTLSVAKTDAIRAAGAIPVVADALVTQSVAGWPYAREGGPVKTEADLLDSEPPAAFRRTLEAIRHLEATVVEIGGPEGLLERG